MKQILLIFIMVLLVANAFAIPLGSEPIIKEDPECDTPVTSISDITIPEIWKLLQAANSPLSQADASYLYNQGVKSGIDPAVLMAFFKIESQYGTDGIATHTHGVGNVRYTSSCSFNYNNFCGYKTWKDSVDAWYSLISGPVYVGSGIDKIETIIPKYAPSNENDVEVYVNFVRKFVSKYKGVLPKCNPSDTSGKYETMLSFKENIPYSLDIYSVLTEEAKNLVETCAFEKDFESCVDKYITNFNTKFPKYKWGYSCDVGPEQVFNQLLEQYRDCKNAFSDQCICTINLNHPESKLVNKDYKVAIEQSGNKTMFSLMEPEININMYEVVDNSQLSIVDGTLNSVDDATSLLVPFPPKGVYQVSYKHGKSQVVALVDLDMLLSTQIVNDIPLGSDTLHIFKNRSLIAFIPEFEYLADAWHLLPECVINKRNYRFCVKDKQHSFMVYDPVDDKDPSEESHKFKSPEIRFALHIRDLVPPPPIENIHVSDAKKSETEIIISWDKSNATDTVLYTVHIGHSDFTFAHLAPIEHSFDPRKVDCVLDSIDLNSGKLSGEDYIYDTVKDGNSVSQPLVHDKPCLVKDKYVMLIDGLTKGDTLFVAVTATDDSNNVDDEVKAMKVKVIDDLAPGVAKDVDFTADENYVIVSWTPPKTKEDLSDLDDLNGYNIRYMVYPFDFARAQSIIARKVSSYRLSIPNRQSPYCVHVAPFDTEGNENKNLSQLKCA